MCLSVCVEQLAVSVGLRSFACSSLKGVMRQFPLYVGFSAGATHTPTCLVAQLSAFVGVGWGAGVRHMSTCVCVPVCACGGFAFAGAPDPPMTLPVDAFGPDPSQVLSYGRHVGV
jgi:hypothetical protein